MMEKEKILVIDDKAINVSLLIGMLKTEYQVVVAKNGEKGLELAQADEPPGLILLDIQMPDMDGFEVCRRLKADEATNGIPIVFITAAGDEESEATGFELGAVDFLHKPFSPHIVQARVKTHIKLRQSLLGNAPLKGGRTPVASSSPNNTLQLFKKDLIEFINGWTATNQ